jgi:enoyl-CoA hydratase/carnithine racemase
MGEVLERAHETAAVIAGNAPLSVRQIKKSVRYGGQMELRTAYRFEVEAYNHLVGTQDRMEGVRAFNEKRPRFHGAVTPRSPCLNSQLTVRGQP